MRTAGDETAGDEEGAAIGSGIEAEVAIGMDAVRGAKAEGIAIEVIAVESRRKSVRIAFRELASRIESKGIRTDTVIAAYEEVAMPPSNEELMRELTRLRTEIQQLREVVSALFNAVFEEGDEDFDTVPEKDEFNLYN